MIGSLRDEGWGKDCICFAAALRGGSCAAGNT